MSISIKTELEWPYHPADFFEAPYQSQTDAYMIVADAGAVLVTLAAASDPIDPRLQDQITKHIKGLFLARQLLVHRRFRLESVRVCQHRSDGGKDRSIGFAAKVSFVAAIASEHLSTSNNPDVVIHNASGKRLQDSKSKRITELSPRQKAEIEERPTQDLDAFELYLQAKAIVDSYLNATDVRAALLQALKSLDEAINRDPNFVSAYCYIARANDLLFFFDLDPSQERISLADAAVKAALRLRPDSAEAHFAKADYDFRCLRDYDHAQEELAIARPGLPNSTPFLILSGYINRRCNHFPDAERDFSAAFALDPRNPNAYNLLADTYVLQRRFPEAVHVYDNVLAAGEQVPIVRFRRASCVFSGTGDSGSLRDILLKFPDVEFAGSQTPARVLMAMLDGNYAEADRALADSPRQDFQDIDLSFYFPKSWYQAMIARAKGDSARATAAFRQCREILAQRLIIKPEHARTIAVLAQVDAGLGEKDLAIREAQHAIDVMPISKDIYDGALVLEGLAQVYAWSGDRDRAIGLVQKLVTMPSYINYARLKFHPLWSPLRGDPRFEKIVNSLAPTKAK